MDSGHVRSIPIVGESGGSIFVEGFSALRSSRRGGSSARDFVDVGRLDQCGSRRSLRCDSVLGSALAPLVFDRRCGSVALDHCAWSGPEQRRACACGCAGDPGRTGREPGELDTAPAASGDRATSRDQHLEIAAEHSAAEKRGFRWRRPRHTLIGRQDPEAVDRVGLRLKLRKEQAEAGDIVLLYSDESEALTHPYLSQAWAKRGADLRIAAPGQAKKVALMGALDWARRELIVHTSRTKRSTDFIDLLEIIDQRYAPRPDRNAKPVVLVLDNGPIHTSKLSTAALKARDWITVEWLPRYAPELNDIENSWRDLKRHHLAHQTFKDDDALEKAIQPAIEKLNLERAIPHLCDNPRIAA